MTRNILHISNTDVRNDSRILKEINSLNQIPQLNIHAIGVPSEKNKPSMFCDFTYHGVNINFSKFHFLPRPIKYFIQLIEFTFKSYWIVMKVNPTVIHCHDTFALPVGWIAKSILKCKLIYDAHELESNKNGQNFILANCTLLIERFCWNKIDLLVSVSEQIIRWYSVNLGFKKSLLVLNAPITSKTDYKIYRHKKERYFHQLYDIPEPALIFLYLGNFSRGRGIELILDIFSKLSVKAHVIFVGDGELDDLIKLSANKNINIHLHQPVPHDQVVQITKNSDYGFCLIENASLSDFYSLPNKLFEYCFSGVPVIASNFPEIKNIVEKYSLGICCNPTLNNVKEVVLDVISRPIKYEISSDITPLSWDAQSTRLISAYKNMLRSND